eukprot:m.73220 g.73220  ORF g.73220 m.73220 type:complete len:415 (-) comp14317_c0_seq3:184-1428(-)
MTSLGIWALTLPFVLLGASLCVGAGIGGGAVYVSIYFLILGMDAHGAIPLSKATIFGLSLAAYSVNLWKRHPTARHRPLIDYDTALMLEPMTLLGGILGVILNIIFPNWLVLLPLSILLAVVAYRTIGKGMRLHKKEQAEAAARRQNDGIDTAALLENEEEAESVNLDVSAESQDRDAQLRTLYTAEGRLVYWDRVGWLVLVWIGYFSLTYVLYKADDVVERCSGGWVALILMAIPYVGIITYFAGRRAHALTLHKRSLDYTFAEGDIRWEGENLWKYPMLAFFAGLAASMLGIGGGLVKGPIMLAMGILPQVATTTSSFMIIFTSSASTLQYFILGKLELGEMAAVMTAGFIGAVIGQRGVNYLVQKYRKQSLLIFLLGGLTVISVILITSLALASGEFGRGGVSAKAFCNGE